ncbi:unnamed product [Ostreococcus tauri]|uniref:Unnamed product n=1 Tax=Ostreococcus tauri TaxID=70448 RepID=A0A090M923_OSTTA|nr:unnamed product [Ostreococcus tauri]CEF98634.1 unnamed product [Ostreococcus tauri]|eukprot:XP_022839385.1 unnamed product [Ostreococcus tauri]
MLARASCKGAPTTGRARRVDARSVRAVTPSRARGIVTRAGSDDFTPEKIMQKYDEITYKIPAVATAASVPVVGLSLVCKTLTGHGLPGTLLGSVEGISWLVLALGAKSFWPKAQDIARLGEKSPENVMKILQAEGRVYGGFGEDSRGKNATERLSAISKEVDPNSPLGQQMADIARQKAEREKETPEEKAARERLRAELAAAALGMANNKTKEFEAEADTKGKDGLLSKPVTETLKDSMTVENYDVDVTKYDDKALGSKLNLSSTNVEMGVPKNNKGDAWREQYRTEENEAGKAD